MMKNWPSTKVSLMARRLTCGLTIVAALAGCEVRPGGGEQPQPAAIETAAADAATGHPEAGAASIIREDAGGQPVIKLPPKPLTVAVPIADSGAQMSAEAEQVLSGVLQSAQIQQDWPIILGGHTDSAGNDQANLRASRARAEEVAAWLVERGVADKRIIVIGFGEQNPVAPNALPDGTPNEPGRIRNRRVEITIAPPPPAHPVAAKLPVPSASGSAAATQKLLPPPKPKG